MLSSFPVVAPPSLGVERIEPSAAAETALPPLDFSSPAPQLLPIRFTASGAAYFRIWIVNLLLSVLSLGVFSAWAKVRREQFFHRHTRIDDMPLDYTARPLGILRGRLIAVVLFALWYCSDYFILPIQIALIVLALVSVPLLSWSALRFRCANTRWRGIPFRFDGRVRDLYRIWLGGAIRTVLTLGFGVHRLRRNLAHYTINHLAFGNQQGRNTMDMNALRRIYLGTAGMAVIGLIALSMLLVMAYRTASGNSDVVAIASLVGFAAFYQWMFARIFVLRANVVGSTSRIGCVRFSVDIPLRTWLRTLFLGLIACLLSMGLYWPWLAISLRRLRLEHSIALLDGSLSEIRAREAVQGEAVADAAADWFDLDFGL